MSIKIISRNIARLRLDDSQRAAIRQVHTELLRLDGVHSESRFLDVAHLFSQELPRSLRETFHEFRSTDSFIALLVEGSPITPTEIGPTPPSHIKIGEDRPLNSAQLLHGLYACLLGDPIGFQTQQKGRIFNDLISIPGAPGNSSSGKGNIGLHTEAYSLTQPYMPDYLGMMCLRNNQHANTTLSYIDVTSLPAAVVSVLSRDIPFVDAPPGPVLFGDISRPFLRFAAFDLPRCTTDVTNALEALSLELHRHKITLELARGDCLYIDNFTAVHGRVSFEAEYGPEGRWFSRLCIVRDLRMTRSLRTSSTSRVLSKERTDLEAMKWKTST